MPSRARTSTRTRTVCSRPEPREDAVRSNRHTAAKAALKRKKQHQHNLDQTEAQIGTLEQQANAIESANINIWTLDAMKKASDAMGDIQKNLSPDKVDETMYASFAVNFFLWRCI